MKKNYMKPELWIVEIEAGALLAVSLGANMNNSGKNDVIFETEKQRNKWGNVWE